MDFFKLRVLNTFLFLLLGAALGYLFSRGAGHPVAPEAPAPRAAAQPADEIFNPDYPEVNTDAETAAGEPGKDGHSAEDKEYEVEVPAEEADAASPKPASAAARPADADDFVVRGRAAAFFSDPTGFSGSEMEMELQMITARKLTGGWRLNFLHSGAGRQLNYIYIDDDRVLGESPDLRIGYMYLVRFECRKGDLSSGNRLVFVKATGGKASWATGISAVE